MQRRPRLLDLCCGAGGVASGYYRAGFEVIGVDIKPQPNYPFEFVHRDALDVLNEWTLAHDFDAIHASFPCQSKTAYRRKGHGVGDGYLNLVPEGRRRILKTGLPYVIENVPGARGELIDPVMLCGAMFPALRTYRHRYFETNWPLTVPLHPQHVAPQVKMGRAPKPGEWVQAVGNFSGAAEAREAMGIDWMNRDGLRECIPPAYTEWIGQQLMAEIQQREEIAA